MAGAGVRIGREVVRILPVSGRPDGQAVLGGCVRADGVIRVEVAAIAGREEHEEIRVVPHGVVDLRGLGRVARIRECPPAVGVDEGGRRRRRHGKAGRLAEVLRPQARVHGRKEEIMKIAGRVDPDAESRQVLDLELRPVGDPVAVEHTPGRIVAGRRARDVRAMLDRRRSIGRSIRVVRVGILVTVPPRVPRHVIRRHLPVARAGRLVGAIPEEIDEGVVVPVDPGVADCDGLAEPGESAQVLGPLFGLDIVALHDPGRPVVREGNGQFPLDPDHPRLLRQAMEEAARHLAPHRAALVPGLGHLGGVIAPQESGDVLRLAPPQDAQTHRENQGRVHLLRPSSGRAFLGTLELLEYPVDHLVELDREIGRELERRLQEPGPADRGEIPGVVDLARVRLHEIGIDGDVPEHADAQGFQLLPHRACDRRLELDDVGGPLLRRRRVTQPRC